MEEVKEKDKRTNSPVNVEEAHLSENGHTDVGVAGFIDENGQLVWRDRCCDGFLSRLGRQTHCQVCNVCLASSQPKYQPLFRGPSLFLGYLLHSDS